MQIKCKYCGAAIEDGSKKCPFCGAALEQTVAQKTVSAPVSVDDEYNELDFFSRADWQRCWEDFSASGNAGLILTDTSQLKNKEYYMMELAAYVKARQPQARYTLLDISNQAVAKTSADCEQIVDLLDEIYSVAVPAYLLIVGDEKVIPFMKWENGAGDRDKYVPSDLAYLTLDTRSPWDGMEYSFEDCTKVGRIPASPENGFIEAIKYFKFTASYAPQTEVKGFAYSAYVWSDPSERVFKRLNCPVDTSPIYTTNGEFIRYYGLKRPPDVSAFNLLGINLHGSDTAHDWYGQIGDTCIEAFDAGCLPVSKTGYTLCVEACYGARPRVLPGREQSIVVTALTNKCVAFVGSTRIAFGAPSEGAELCCADIIAQTFIDSIIDGKTAGAAFVDALTAVNESGDDEDTIKTLAEFALYGDPSVVPFNTGKLATFACATKAAKKAGKSCNASGAIKLIPCDEETAGLSNFAFSNYAAEVKQAEKTVKLVQQVSDGFVSKTFTAFSSVKPAVFKVAGNDSYRTVYTTTIGNVTSTVKLHLDGEGNIVKTHVSK